MPVVNNLDVWDNSAVGLIACDAVGKIVRVNKAFCSLVGYTEYELYQRTVWDITADDDSEISKQRFAELQAGIVPHYTLEKRYIKKDGTITWVRLIVSSLDNLNIGFAENISARKNYEQEMNIAYEQAKMYAEDLRNEVHRRKQLAEELQSFLYVAAHDIQEPIRTAANYFQLLELKVAEVLAAGEEAAEAISIVKDNLHWATQLINSLLRYSRIEQSELGLVNACELIDTVKYALIVLIEEKQASLTVDCDCNLSVIINQVNAQRVLQNLLQNALKYSAKPAVIIGCQAEGDYVKFTVADNGSGIDKRYYDLIFQPFKRLVKTPDGTGIGLAECKRIVELYGGSIWVESEIDKGSTFYFTLPLGLG